MDTMRSYRGIAFRLGRWSAEHRWKATLLWVGLFLLMLIIGASAKKLTAAGETSGDSAKAERLLEHSGFNRPAVEEVLLQVRGQGDIRSPLGRKAASDVMAAVAATHRVTSLRSPFAAGN